jgi:hypothetical protein
MRERRFCVEVRSLLDFAGCKFVLCMEVECEKKEVLLENF